MSSKTNAISNENIQKHSVMEALIQTTITIYEIKEGFEPFVVTAISIVDTE